MKKEREVGLSNVNRVKEFLKKNCNKFFTTKELAKKLAEMYPEECKKKMEKSMQDKVKNSKEGCIRQVAAEIVSDINKYKDSECIEVIEESSGGKSKYKLKYKCNCEESNEALKDSSDKKEDDKKENNKCVVSEVEILKNNYQIILQGPPGTGKTRLAKIIAVNLVSGQNVLCLSDNNEKIKKEFEKLKDQIKIIQFHPSYSYEDFVRGIVAKPRGMNIMYKTENKILAKMAEEAQKEFDKVKEEMKDENDEQILKKCKKYVLIIDEINRANLSSVLGELIYALEYRGEEVESMYELYGNRKIVLPKNLYIIGTMNTADRSVGHIDYAIRRRFTFIDILPDKNIITDTHAKQLFEEVEKIFDKKNGYLSPEFDKNDVMIGHSYFLDNNLENALEYKIKPLLLEYVKDGVLKDEAKKEIEKLKV